MNQEGSFEQSFRKYGELALRTTLATLQTPLPSTALVAAFSQAESHTLYAQAAPIPFAPIQAGNCEVVFFVEAFNFAKGPIPEQQRVKGLGGKIVFNESDRITTPINGEVVDLRVGVIPIHTVTDQYGRGIYYDETETAFNRFKLIGPNDSEDELRHSAFRIEVFDQNSGEQASKTLTCNTNTANPIRILRYQAAPPPTPDQTLQPVGTPQPLASPSERTLVVPGGPYPGQERTAVINVSQVVESIKATATALSQARATPPPDKEKVALRATSTALVRERDIAVAVAATLVEISKQQAANNSASSGAAKSGGAESGDVMTGLRDNAGNAIAWLGDHVWVGVVAVTLGLVVTFRILALPWLQRQMRPAAEVPEPEEPDDPDDRGGGRPDGGAPGGPRPIRPLGPGRPTP